MINDKIINRVNYLENGTGSIIRIMLVKQLTHNLWNSRSYFQTQDTSRRDEIMVLQIIGGTCKK